MANKKTTNKKTTRSTPKKATVKKPVTKKTVAKKQVAKKAMPAVRRPPNSSNIPPIKAGQIAEDLNKIKVDLETYAAHLRALDRKRLNGVGIKKQGFIQRALEIAIENPEFLPHYLTLAKFHNDNDYFQSFRMMCDTAQQVRELLWNITIEASDVVYTDALEYYASVREAAKRRVDAAETLHTELAAFFKSRGTRTGDGTEPTKKELKRDMNALLNGRRDGKIVIENIRPKTTAGVHKVLDEKFANSEHYKETEQGEITE
jgi:hypothetical protein